MTDMTAIGVRSAALRGSRAQIRRDLRTGAVTLADLFAAPPACIHGLTVLDVLRMLRCDRSANAWEHELGQHALRAQVNVLVRVGVASERTLEWAAENGQWHVVQWRQRTRRAVVA